MPGEVTGPDAAVMKEATKVVAGEGVIKFDIGHRVRADYGRQLGVAGSKIAPVTAGGKKKLQ
jgi:hypothetical protein